MKRIYLLLTVSALCMSSCATIISGTTQDVTFAAPEGTKIYHQGVRITEIKQDESSSTVRLRKNLSSQTLIAKKTGYQDTPFILKANLNGVVFLNIFFGLFIGAAIDCATGAACKYDNYVEIDLYPKE